MSGTLVIKIFGHSDVEVGAESINTHIKLNYVIPLPCFISLSAPSLLRYNGFSFMSWVWKDKSSNLDFCNIKEFMKHTKIHGEKLFKCPQCDKLAASKRLLNDHKRNVHGNRIKFSHCDLYL